MTTDEHLRIAHRHLEDVHDILVPGLEIDHLCRALLKLATDAITLVAGRKRCLNCHRWFDSLDRRADAIYCSKKCSSQHSSNDLRKRRGET